MCYGHTCNTAMDTIKHIWCGQPSLHQRVSQYVSFDLVQRLSPDCTQSGLNLRPTLRCTGNYLSGFFYSCLDGGSLFRPTTNLANLGWISDKPFTILSVSKISICHVTNLEASASEAGGPCKQRTHCHPHTHVRAHARTHAHTH